MRSKKMMTSLMAGALALSACGDTGYSESPYQPPPPAVPATTPGSLPPNGEPYDDVYFDNPGVNPFIDAEDDPFSTFGLDVDTGSYTVGRRWVTDGYLPHKDSVRVEEYVNFFDQEYPIPGEGLALYVDGGPTPFLQNERNQVVRVGVQAAQVDAIARPDANLVFVIDTSGSMDMENRLELVKQSLEILVSALRPTDTVGIVAYGSQARQVLAPTPISEEGTILQAIHSLHPDGSTNAAAGLGIGYSLANSAFKSGGINRVILCSDGVANVGSATDAEGILDLIAEDAERGIELVTVGFGMGNYNDTLMEQLADRGDGFYAYVDTVDEARRLFVDDLSSTLQTVAKEARIQVEFDPGTVQSWRLIGFENRAIDDDQFRDDTVDAGELGAGHTVTALYEVKPIDSDTGNQVGVVRLRWLDPDTGQALEIEAPIGMSQLAPSFEASAPRFQQDVIVAQYAEVLRESVWADQTGTDLQDVAAWAGRLRSVLPNDVDVLEFVDLVERATLFDS